MDFSGNRLDAMKTRGELQDAFETVSLDEIREYLESHTDEIGPSDGSRSWLSFAAFAGRLDAAKLLIELGANLNHGLEERFNIPIHAAIREGHMEIARLLLENGANPNCNAVVLAAMDGQLAFVQLLDEYGADLHYEYPHVRTGKPVNALSFASDPEVAEYLISRGVKSLSSSKKSAISFADIDAKLTERLEATYGAFDVLSTPATDIQFLVARDTSECQTLSTFGISRREMHVPSGHEAYKRAELIIQLPSNWRLDQESQLTAHWGWPIEWLTWIAEMPHDQHTWLGGPVTIACKEVPPEPFIPGKEFTCMLLVAEPEPVLLPNRQRINLYYCIPIFTSERQYEIDHGANALLIALGESGVGFKFDPDRSCVV